MDETRVIKDDSSKYHMMGGDGPNSYFRNSAYQKELVVSTSELFRDMIKKHLDAPERSFDLSGTFRIADLGSSIGPNAFSAVANIIAAVENANEVSSEDRLLEFHVLFNDLVENDFNTLFKNVPSSRGYFFAAAPGSFHGRLFPKKTLHFVHCSTALHWLSRIPEEVVERSSNAWNKGRVHYFGAGSEVWNAYFAQYRKDMEAFLNARGDELVDGGLMALVILGFPNEHARSSYSSIAVAFDILRSCLVDMVNKGKVREEDLDSFNLPFYYPSPSEMVALIEANGVFSVEKVAELASPLRANSDAQILTSHLRAVIGVLLEYHFGSGIVEELFKLHLQKLSNSAILGDPTYQKEINFFLFLKRKPSKIK